MIDMGYVQVVFSFLGGLGLFIYGMHVMAAGLQKSAGNKMKQLLEALTKNKLMGVLVGALVTGVIQSSSATTVMVVGFVNAGLMNLTQSVGIIMGANIGTTVTGWLVASAEWTTYLNPIFLAPLAVAIGAAMVLFAVKDRTRQIGEIIVGFGILFIGMATMSGAVEPFKQSPVFREIFLMLGSNPILGLLAGAIVTCIIQSSSASVAILQSLAIVGLVPWNAAVYIIMGQNIGTCITAILSSIGASKNAKAAAYIHLLFNVIGSVFFSIIGIVFFTVINKGFGEMLISGTQISTVHTLFNICNTITLYHFSDFLIKAAKKLASVNEGQQDEEEIIHLDERILETPAFAIENCKKEILRLGGITLDNLRLSVEAFFSKDREMIDKVLKRENTIDTLAQAITHYLVKISAADISNEENTDISTLFHTVDDIERIGDHCENIAELTQFAIAEDLSISESAVAGLNNIISLTVSCFENSLKALELSDKTIVATVERQEEEIDKMEKELRASHILRLSNGECGPKTSVVFLDLLTNLERVGDHSSNIVEGVMQSGTHKKG